MSSNKELRHKGFTWERCLLDKQAFDWLRSELDPGSRPGNRISHETIDQIRNHIDPIIQRANELLPNSKIVQATSFNKTENANWSLGWHQDRVIAVAEKREVAGYNNWTRKKGVWYCEPPIEILENMVFARIHLDAATSDNGCLVVAHSSHLYGRIAQSNMSRVIEKSKPELCDAEAGDVMFAKSLLVHRSNPSISTDPRLAIRLDFANIELPAPLKWTY